jgi:hypothetical protein
MLKLLSSCFAEIDFACCRSYNDDRSSWAIRCMLLCLMVIGITTPITGLSLMLQEVVMSISSRASDMCLLSIFPDSKPVRRLIVCQPGWPAEQVDAWIWLRCLQGLVNREEPQLYLMTGELRDPAAKTACHEDHWLTWYQEKYRIPVERVDDPEAVLAHFRHMVTGYVLYDTETVLQTQNLAITRCGLDGTLPVAPDQEPVMIRQGLTCVDDLRGRFADDWDAAEWAIDNLWPRCNKRMYANFCVHRPEWYALSHELEDYVVANRVLALDLPRSRVFRRTINLFRRMMETAEAPGVQLNWHCIWDQEKEYIAEAAERGFFSLCSVRSPNMTVHAGIGDPKRSYSQPLPPAEQCVAEPDKVYVCFYNSDGDATWAMQNLHSDNWLDPDRGSFPFGWGFLPLMVKLMPGMLQYYQETRLPNDCFWGPSSGAGYTYSWLWPEDLVDAYLKDSRRLLDQSGQNGCNMVNWFLRDWWREVEDDRAVAREQELLAPGPGLVCGLGGSPFAQSYPAGTIPKLHSVHIANVGRDNIGDIIRLSRECPTRPAFYFLFAQISKGVFHQLDSEMNRLADHPEIEILSMDHFFLTLQNARERGMISEPLYEKTDALAETWLKAPGRNRLPLYERLTAELSRVAQAGPCERRRHLGKAGWTQLVSAEIENVATDRDRFLNYFAGRTPPTVAEEADALFYVAFTVAWGLVRSALEAQGIYANHRDQCLADFCRTCSAITDIAPITALFAAWQDWEKQTPLLDQTIAWCLAIDQAARDLVDRFGPDENETFSGWPPRTI